MFEEPAIIIKFKFAASSAWYGIDSGEHKSNRRIALFIQEFGVFDKHAHASQRIEKIRKIDQANVFVFVLTARTLLCDKNKVPPCSPLNTFTSVKPAPSTSLLNLSQKNNLSARVYIVIAMFNRLSSRVR